MCYHCSSTFFSAGAPVLSMGVVSLIETDYKSDIQCNKKQLFGSSWIVYKLSLCIIR